LENSNESRKGIIKWNTLNLGKFKRKQEGHITKEHTEPWEIQTKTGRAYFNGTH